MDYLRAISTLLVVCIHVAQGPLYSLEIGCDLWAVSNIIESFSMCAVPVFVMISGRIFLNSDKRIKDLWQQNINRIVKVLVFFLVIYSIFAHWVLKKSIEESIVWAIESPLWFLWMIIGLYMMIPFLKMICEKNLQYYFLSLWLMVNFIVPLAIEIINRVVPVLNSYLLYVIGHEMQIVIGYLKLDFFMGYSGYFLLGYVIDDVATTLGERRIIQKQWPKYLALCGILILGGVMLIAVIAERIAMSNQQISMEVYGNFTIGILIESIVFYGVLSLCVRGKEDRLLHRVIMSVSKYSFGIYLWHAIVLVSMNQLMGISIGSIWYIPIMVTSVAVISMVLSMLSKRIPLIGQWL